jgi:1-acyl-sn-glycerol-3-phosphate acyltransferase
LKALLAALRWPLDVALSALIFAYFGVGGLVLSWVVLPLAGLGESDPDAKVRRAHAIIARGYDSFHALMRWTRQLEFDPRACEVRLPPGPCVVIANHPTLVDTPAAMSLLRSGCLIVKSSVFRSVLFRGLHHHAANIEAVEDGPVGGEAVIEAALQRLARGFPVLIFPEGTRSPVGGLRRFRRGAFEIAERAGVPLVPLLIMCDPPRMMKGVPWWTIPQRLARLRITALPTVDLDAEGLRGSLAIARHVQGLYHRALTRTASETPS